MCFRIPRRLAHGALSFLAVPWILGLCWVAFTPALLSAAVEPGSVEGPAIEPIVIPPGSDCWATECGRTKLSFCDTQGTVIPADFFAPGSEPFFGEVLFGGSGGLVDTQMQRLGEMLLPDIGSEAMVPIQMQQLELESCQPITVVIEGEPTEWDVRASLSEEPSGEGQLTVIRSHPNGGTFQAEFPLHIRFTFTRVDDPLVEVVLDSGLMGLPPFPFLTTGDPPWVSELLGPTPPVVCGVGFVPGLEEHPVTSEQCCRKVGHAGPGHVHETAPPDCSACPPGACCDAVAGTCTVTTAELCTAEFKGLGTDCLDKDGDGIPDILETNNCCSVPDLCNQGTDPSNPDTDGDGINDGVEIALGLDPCRSDHFFEDGFESGDTTAWPSIQP